MSLRSIINYPHRVLSTIGDPITVFDESLKKLTEDMFETMYATSGVGLAASQIGLSLRLFVMDCDGLKLTAANPMIISQNGVQEGSEGCLSIKGIYYPLRRAQIAVLRAQDLNGEFYEIEGEGLIARCFLHETDHCDGKLYIHRLSPLQRDVVLRKYKKARTQLA